MSLAVFHTFSCSYRCGTQAILSMTMNKTIVGLSLDRVESHGHRPDGGPNGSFFMLPVTCVLMDKVMQSGAWGPRGCRGVTADCAHTYT